MHENIAPILAQCIWVKNERRGIFPVNDKLRMMTKSWLLHKNFHFWRMFLFTIESKQKTRLLTSCKIESFNTESQSGLILLEICFSIPKSCKWVIELNYSKFVESHNERFFWYAFNYHGFHILWLSVPICFLLPVEPISDEIILFSYLPFVSSFRRISTWQKTTQ